MPDTDARPRVTAAVDVNLRQLADELGDDRLALGEDGRTVVAATDSGITKAQLQAAVDAHTPAPPEPDPDDALRDAIGKATTLTELKAALLGTDRPARVAGRPTQ